MNRPRSLWRTLALPLLAAIVAAGLVEWGVPRGPAALWTVETDSLPLVTKDGSLGVWVAPEKKSAISREGPFDWLTGKPRTLPGPSPLAECTHFGPSLCWVRTVSSLRGDVFHAYDRSTGQLVFHREFPECHNFDAGDVLLLSWQENWFLPCLRVQAWSPRPNQCLLDVLVPCAARKIVERSLTLSPDGRWAATHLCHVLPRDKAGYSVHVFDLTASRVACSWFEKEPCRCLWTVGAQELITATHVFHIGTPGSAGRRLVSTGELVADRGFAPARGGKPGTHGRFPWAYHAVRRTWVITDSDLSPPLFPWLPDAIRAELPDSLLQSTFQTNLLLLHEGTGREELLAADIEPFYPPQVVEGAGVLVELPRGNEERVRRYAFYPLAGSYPWPWPWRLVLAALAALLAFGLVRWWMHRPAERVASCVAVACPGSAVAGTSLT